MDRHNIFCYGSNMNLEQMLSRCPSAKIVSTLELSDMELCFPHKAKKRNCGVASIKPREGKSVFGTLYSLSSDDLIKLDRFEGLGNGYSRKFVESDNFWYYYSLKNHRNEFYEPSKEYLNLIIEGASSQHLPSEYINNLKQIRTL